MDNSNKNSYADEKKAFIEERNGLINSINKKFGDEYKEQIEKFVKETDEQLLKLDRHNLTQQYSSKPDKSIISPEDIFRFSTNTSKQFKDIFNSGDENTLNAFKPSIPSVLESISGQLSKSLLQLSIKPEGRGH